MVIDESLDIYSLCQDEKIFENMIYHYDMMDVIEHNQFQLALKYADVTIICELYNSPKFKYHIKCYVGNNRTEYRFDHLPNLESKLDKLDKFIIKQSTCKFK